MYTLSKNHYKDCYSNTKDNNDDDDNDDDEHLRFKHPFSYYKQQKMNGKNNVDDVDDDEHLRFKQRLFLLPNVQHLNQFNENGINSTFNTTSVERKVHSDRKKFKRNFYSEESVLNDQIKAASKKKPTNDMITIKVRKQKKLQETLFPHIYEECAELYVEGADVFIYYTCEGDTIDQILQRYSDVTNQMTLHNLLSVNQREYIGLKKNTHLHRFIPIMIPIHFNFFDYGHYDIKNDNDLIEMCKVVKRNSIPDAGKNIYITAGTVLKLEKTKRFVYYTHNNETPFHISCKFEISVKQILYHNKWCYPCLQENSPLRKGTSIVWPTV